MRLTARVNFNSTLITNISCATPHDLVGRIDRIPLHRYEHNRFGLLSFRQAWKASPVRGTNDQYRDESYERRCVERWFVLLDHMHTTGLNSVVYLDSDCALTQPPEALHMVVKGCDTTLTSDFLWVKARELLQRFVTFSLNLYNKLPYKRHFQDDFSNKTMNDMFLWGMFESASRCSPGAGGVCARLPPVRYEWSHCSLDNSNHQYRRNGFHYDRPSGIASIGNQSVLYVHFQGSRKGDIARFSRTPITSAGAIACERLPNIFCWVWGELENRIGYMIDPYRRLQATNEPQPAIMSSTSQ